MPPLTVEEIKAIYAKIAKPLPVVGGAVVDDYDGAELRRVSAMHVGSDIEHMAEVAKSLPVGPGFR